MAITSEQLQKRITSVASSIKRREGGFLLVAGKRLEGLMKRRIFNEGQAANETQIGKYKSKGWRKIRTKAGNQTRFVDLQFTGDLIRSFKTVRDGDDVVLAIVNDKDAAKARGNEERRKKTIFEPSTDELKRVERYFEDIVSEAVLDEFLKL